MVTSGLIIEVLAGGAVVAVPSGFPAGGPQASSLIFQSLDFLNSKMGINGILFIKIAITR